MKSGDDKRRLSAILAADVVGYTRCMEQDTDGTIAAWKAARIDIIDPTISNYSGRIVKHTGDGFLAEFPTVLEAVQCALDVQKGLTSNPLKFRMGLNLADIVDDGEDIHGEGVNIAARIEALASPGGICISSSIYDQVRNRLNCRFEDMGKREVKHVTAPVQVYRIIMDDSPQVDTENDELVLSDKPSIAVLPFDNLSGDPEQEYFADGLTEDIITALSKIRWFFVIARNSTFVYKGRSIDIREVAKDLGVRYVLEGSVRKAGNRVRLTAQLIDGKTGQHVWAERYDRQLEDIFEVQDELTQTVVGAIEPQLSRAERERARTSKPNSLDAWTLLQKGRSHLFVRTQKELVKAKQLLEQVIELDSTLVAAYVDLAELLFLEVRQGFADDPAAHLAYATRIAGQAVELDPEDAAAHCSVGRVLSMKRKHETAIPEFKAALRLNPSYAMAYFGLGMSLTYSGRPADAISPLETAMRLSPHDVYIGPMMARLAEAYLFLRDHETAVDWARQAVRQRRLMWPGHATYVSILGHLDKTEEAEAAVEELIAQVPNLSVAFVREKLPITSASDLAHLLDGLTKAGIPA